MQYTSRSSNNPTNQPGQQQPQQANRGASERLGGF